MTSTVGQTLSIKCWINASTCRPMCGWKFKTLFFAIMARKQAQVASTVTDATPGAGHRQDEDARGVRAQLAARRRRAGLHLGQDVAAPVSSLSQRHLHDLQRDALHLNTRHHSVRTEVGQGCTRPGSQLFNLSRRLPQTWLIYT